jgi:hypothetical protein
LLKFQTVKSKQVASESLPLMSRIVSHRMMWSLHFPSGVSVSLAAIVAPDPAMWTRQAIKRPGMP